MSKRRSYGWVSFLTIFLVVIICRLSWLQLISTPSAAWLEQDIDLVSQAQDQQDREYVIDSGRGDIWDRRGRVLSGEPDWRLVVFPMTDEQVQHHRTPLEQIGVLISYPQEEWMKWVSENNQPQAVRLPSDSDPIALAEEIVQEIKELHVPGVYVLKADDRLNSKRLARQVLGQVVRSPSLVQAKHQEELDNGQYHLQSLIGVRGLEASFEPILHGGKERSLQYIVDGKGQSVNGLEAKEKVWLAEEPHSPQQVYTSLDRDIQEVVERTLEKEQIAEGAVVVQEIKSGDIVGMGSRPAVDETVLNEEINPWDNRAVMEATPGSIFKTVIAVAALDTGLVRLEDRFHCKGDLGRYGLTDSKHGELSFAEGYAKSCNIVFAQLAEQLGADEIEKYAEKLGLGQPILWRGNFYHEKEFQQLPGEQKGLIFASQTAKHEKGVLAQTGIGQRDVKMTPVQAVNMVSALFHGGQTITPRVVREVRTIDGETSFAFPRQALKTEEPISKTALQQVQTLMKDVVQTGTGMALKEATWSLAGKTGTAQIGVDKDRYNKWFVGYGPTDSPRYAVSVVVNSVEESDDPRHLRVFKEVMDQIAQLEKKWVEAEKKVKQAEAKKKDSLGKEKGEE
ncbi:penicillin-binding protein 2 [Mechercharimyces sp. CAU 1602]|uniref:peptidoglycan D,D-transpeptidase FtsI family protein n=1 Tax=Mechercharimyces sp. CAU 1602 TaxID=2973933 RepID=UPI002162B4DC|nr:penicillin-binding protein 2 [Mechercharimyces sp. CAU 1602]MCS1350271.1 penicillin-binding protein 2 [Mechercharimyces sp. CAU 1602]